MAAFNQAASAHLNSLPTPSSRVSSKRTLPNGPCNHRDKDIGACGCNQFWDKCSAELHDGSSGSFPSSERSTWCVCGHHACFHQQDAPRPAAQVGAVPQRAHAACDGRCASRPGSQCNAHAALTHNTVDTLSLEGGLRGASFGKSQSLSTQRLQRHGASHGSAALPDQQNPETSTQGSTSGFPPIPSVCMLDSHELRPLSHGDTGKVRHDVMGLSRPTGTTGLGLSLMNLGSRLDPTDRPQSVTSTVPDETLNLPKLDNASYSEPEIPATRPNSLPGVDACHASPFRGGPLDAIAEFNRTLAQLETGSDTLPDTYNPDDFIQSATEVATPSNANTPDLGMADQAVQDTKKLVETLTRMTSNPEQAGCDNEVQPNGHANGTPRLMITASPATPQEQLQHVLRSASPQALKQIVSYLSPLHSLLSSFPNVATAIRDLTARLENLEGNSFNYVQPEQVSHELETYDGRLLELEHRLNEHDQLHAAIDADHSSMSRRRVATVTESFSSNVSGNSVSSSALIVAAIDRTEMKTEMDGVKERLDALEAATMPTLVSPWEVEIVLLPWGRELHGIWYLPDEPMNDPSGKITQDTEEWTQARSLRSSSRGRPEHAHSRRNSAHEPESSPFRSDNHEIMAMTRTSGWSSQAISDWADQTDEWLSPKACGSNNLVYKRLHSRGFVRTVTLKSANAGDIQATLASAFSDLLEYLTYTPNGGYQEGAVAAFPGLSATFLPLRKVLKSSRLRFLNQAEMSNPALWSAHFLSEGVLMRVSGGKKRLYMTQRESYMQQADFQERFWSWQRIRELPRFQLSQDPDSQMEGNEENCQPNVPEADAKEACWTYLPAYDPPVSNSSSFSSVHSHQLQLRPVARSLSPNVARSKPRLVSPLTYAKSRTYEYSREEKVEDTANIYTYTHVPDKQAPPPLTRPSSSHKRRYNASPVKQQSKVDFGADAFSSSRSTSLAPSKQKRRRVSKTSADHAQEQGDQAQNQVAIWQNNTPRRSREPPSPFFSSNPELRRTNSDLASHRSQKSGAMHVGKGTPFAYATPHSGTMGGGFGGGGDTEKDDDEEADGTYSDDGQSWAGVEDQDEQDSNNSGSDSGSELSSDAEAGAEPDDDPASFSAGECQAFGDSDDDDLGFGAQYVDDDDDDDEDEDDSDEDPLDALLGVLEN